MDEPIAETGAVQQWRERGRKFWSALVDVITPPRCISCATEVSGDAGLCINCWPKLKLISEPVCDALGTPFEYDEGEGALSPAAIVDPPPWNRARAAVAYDDVGRLLVHALKYQDRHEAAQVMARMMLGAGRKLLADTDVIVPVPLHSRRLWQRRFNQSALLARAVGELGAKPVELSSLLRTKKTRQQVGLDTEERRKNVNRAFAVDPEAIATVSGKSILLIDDVRTTGATAAACAMTLTKAGAARVDVLTFALVLAPYRPDIDV